MAGRSEVVELIAQVTADVSDAVADFDDFGSAVKDAGNEADRASDKVRSVADQADNLDSKSAQATGSLGALSSGFELVGADKYAGALQSAALATDFLAGVGEGLNLILELQSVQWVVNKAKMAANTAATIAMGIATKVAAGFQWALNAALNANPVGLVVLAVLALIGVLILLYKRSSTVRGIIDAVWGAFKAGAKAIPGLVKGAFDAIYNAAVAVVNWFRNTWGTVTSLITTPIKAATDKVKGWFGDVWDKVKGWPKAFGDLFTSIKDAIEGALKGVGSAALDGLKTWAQGMVNIINKLISAFNKLPGPDLPHVPNVQSATTAASRAVAASAAVPSIVGRLSVPTATPTTGGTVVNITVTGAVDPESTARQIRRILGASDTRHGTVVRTLRTA